MGDVSIQNKAVIIIPFYVHGFFRPQPNEKSAERHGELLIKVQKYRKLNVFYVCYSDN